MNNKTVPKIGEIWQEKSGRTRDITFVDDTDLHDDGRWAFVHYKRPAPATEAFATVTLQQWWKWVDEKEAFRTSKG